MNKIFVLSLLFGLAAFSCTEPVKPSLEHPEELIHALNEGLFTTVVEDGFSPPVASRIYAYPNIAAYEMAILGSDTFQTLVGQLNGFTELPTAPSGIDKHVAMIVAFNQVAKHMLYRDHIMDGEAQKLLNKLKPMVGGKTYDNSVAYGETVAKHIKAWADEDGYNYTRTLPKFTVSDSAGAWQPTPPKYGEAIEPHWAQLKPFVMDSTSQFRVALPFGFSTDTSSDYHKATMEVYDMVNNETTEERLEIARFWDCNPVPVLIDGHLMVTNKQNTPPGHWLGITEIAIKAHNLNLQEASEAYTRVMVTVADGFKAAWDTKYATNFLRPETYINKYIDQDWHPRLETPLFPEFTSAHSLISACAATVLADQFGDDFAFEDTTNVRFDLPVRSFTSFRQAAKEAAMSRVYGGIHYIKSCDMAFDQGTLLGELANQRMQTRRPAAISSN